MRLKKGFTLAEILIVLMVIGVIATMTVPSMMKGVAEAQLKTGYKKAYNTIANFSAMERVAGSLPSRVSEDNLKLTYQALNNALSVLSFAQQEPDAGAVLLNSEGTYLGCVETEINGGEVVIGTEGGDCHELVTDVTDGGESELTDEVTWLVTEDNFGYAVLMGGATGNCATKQAIAAAADDSAAVGLSCMIVIADVNGLTKGPNALEVQGVTSALEEDAQMDTITADRYKIYLGIDGAAAGPRLTTATGRIIADIK